MALRESFVEILSTQDRAIELARSGAEPGTRIVAQLQTGGRGRSDHRWASPIGGLYLSVILGPLGGGTPLLSLAVAAHLARGLSDRYSVRLGLKWPNDVVDVELARTPRKLAGVLVDNVVTSDGGRALVVGLGVNVRVPRDAFPPRLWPHVTSLSDHLPDPPRVEEVESVAHESVLSAHQVLTTPAGERDTVEACRGLLVGVGREAWIDGHRAGRITSLGPDGELWLEGDAGRIAVRSGELRWGAEA